MTSVVIPCFNQAEYLGEAIESVFAQTDQNFEIIVVDDGSTDATPDVARRYPQVRYLRQRNQGLSAARNAGMEACHGRYLVFLDADDRLLPEALSAGMRCIEDHPECAFVSGGHRRIDQAGRVIEQPTPPRIKRDHYLALLRGNYVGMHAAVMYRRSLLQAVGGFQEGLPACEDYELYFRLSRIHPVCCHQAVVAEYRSYGTSMSANTAIMLPTVLSVLRSQRSHLSQDRRRREAYAAGMLYWRKFHAKQFTDQLPASWAGGEYRTILRGVVAIGRYAPRQFWKLAYPRWVRPTLPTAVLRLAASLGGRSYYPSAGKVRFGDLRRVSPISAWFGFDRGSPIDHFYIQRFLAAHSDDICGQVLEVGDAEYTQQFGGGRVTRSDILHVAEGNPRATIVGDLTAAEHIPSNAFDCVIVTQTLHLIYDVRSAVGTLFRILKPGGVLLVTAPGISEISKDERAKSWYWSFTTLSVRRLLDEFFPPENVHVEACGNVLAATAFLQGIAAGELEPAELQFRDQQYEMLITARAAKPSPANDVSALV